MSSLVIINKIDLAGAVGADLTVMERGANRMRITMNGRVTAPTIFAAIEHGVKLPEIIDFILDKYRAAGANSASSSSVNSNNNNNQIIFLVETNKQQALTSHINLYGRNRKALAGCFIAAVQVPLLFLLERTVVASFLQIEA